MYKRSKFSESRFDFRQFGYIIVHAFLQERCPMWDLRDYDRYS